MKVLTYFITMLAVLGLNTASAAYQRRGASSSQQNNNVQSDPRCASPCYMPPDCALSDQVPSAYNMSARIDPTRSYDLFLNASFIYWNVSQDNMDIGRPAVFVAAMEGVPTPVADAEVLVQSFDYHPGFKVGIGYGSDFDNWQVEAEYTYLHYGKTFNAGSSAASFSAGDQILIANDWYVNLAPNAPTTPVQIQLAKMTSKWKMHLDMFDALLSRPFYQGQRVTVTPYVGLRALWLRQSFKIVSQLADDPAGVSAISENRSRGWALGPNLSAGLNWLLGKGFRFEFDAGMSLLYTRYTTLVHMESLPSSVSTTALNGHWPERGYLRAINELGLGLGWGKYFSNKRFHIDFSATYDFMILWSQNMMRYTTSSLANFSSGGYAGAIGDLYLHGLTLTGRFDF